MGLNCFIHSFGSTLANDLIVLNLCGRGEVTILMAFDNKLAGGLPETLGDCESLNDVHNSSVSYLQNFFKKEDKYNNGSDTSISYAWRGRW